MSVSYDENIAALLDDVIKNRKGAFETLIKIYNPMLTVLASRFSSPALSYDEARQVAEIALYRAACSYRAEKRVNFGYYAKICISNALMTENKRTARDVKLISLDELSDEAGGSFVFGSDSPDIADSMISEERWHNLVKRAKELLPEYQFRVFALYSGGCDAEEISKILGKSRKSVENAIFRMFVKLRSNKTLFTD